LSLRGGFATKQSRFNKFLRLIKRALQVILVLLSAALVLGAVIQSRSEQRNLAKYTPLGQIFEIGGKKMHLYCLGDPVPGIPTVILEAGTGDNHLTWYDIQRQISQVTRVCSYDRLGYGWSDAAQGKRSVDRIAGELNALLETADISPPYVLVGHSFGGLAARYFAARYPEKVKGLVLIDATPASTLLKRQSGIRKPLLLIPPTLTELGALFQRVGLLQWLTEKGIISRFEPLLPLPPELLPQAKTLYYRYRTLATSANEQLYLASSARMTVDLPLPADLPVIAYVSSLEGNSAMLPMIQAEFASLSHHSQVKVLPNGHYLHLERPNLILVDLQELLGSMR
jgi:pimeloyl-ACP methyl ester carboxylesterase